MTAMDAYTQTGATIVFNTPGDAEDFNEFDNICDSDAGTTWWKVYLSSCYTTPQCQQAPGSGSIEINVGSTGLGYLKKRYVVVYLWAVLDSNQ
jgi:hypothetical protein